jgi:dipeptidyl aminopeptidase/acylaminoacyl peptidase
MTHALQEMAMRRSAAIACVALTLAACGGSSPAAPTPVTSGRFDVAIPGAGVTIGGVLYRPDLAPGERQPGLIFVHGHLAAGVNGAATVEGFARRYRDRGYVAVAISMRGWPPSGGQDDCALEQPSDIVQVVEWLKRQPGVDPARTALVGFSKGGQMVLLAAARGADVRAVVAYYPPTDLARWKATTTREDTIAYITRLCEPAPGLTPRSPASVAGAIVAPVLLMHGDADVNVPLEQSQVMEAAMRAAGRSVELFVVPGGEHGFVGAAAEIAFPVVDGFLAARLR